MTLTGAGRLAAVLGWPIKHSRSPQLHGHWLNRLQLDGAVVPLSVQPEHLPDAFRTLPRIGFVGWCLTVPHKEAALALVDEVTETAHAIGSINHVTVATDGRLVGNNTDAFGFLASVQADVPIWSPPDGPVTVIGAGGAARAVVWALLSAGVPEIRLCNRTLARAETLASSLGSRVTVVDWGERHRALAGCAMLVNTTSLGMTGQPPLRIELDALPRSAIVADIVYAPLETDLLLKAQRRGHPTVGGLGMLLHQARPLFESWFGVDPPVDEALRQAVLGLSVR